MKKITGLHDHAKNGFNKPYQNEESKIIYFLIEVLAGFQNGTGLEKTQADKVRMKLLSAYETGENEVQIEDAECSILLRAIDEAKVITHIYVQLTNCISDVVEQKA